jgi:hypothetical protein
MTYRREIWDSYGLQEKKYWIVMMYRREIWDSYGLQERNI